MSTKKFLDLIGLQQYHNNLKDLFVIKQNLVDEYQEAVEKTAASQKWVEGAIAASLDGKELIDTTYTSGDSYLSVEQPQVQGGEGTISLADGMVQLASDETGLTDPRKLATKGYVDYLSKATNERIDSLLPENTLTGIVSAGEIAVGGENNSITSTGYTFGGTVLAETPSDRVVATEAAVYTAVSSATGEVNDRVSGLRVEYDSDQKKIYLKDSNGRFADPIDASSFIKDGMVSSGSVVENPEGQPEGTYIKLVFNTDAGQEDIFIPATSLVDQYEAGNAGIVISDYTISTVVSQGEESKKYLAIASDGLSVTGIDQAISDAVAAIDLGVTKVTSSDGTLIVSANTGEVDLVLNVAPAVETADFDTTTSVDSVYKTSLLEVAQDGKVSADANMITKYDIEQLF